MAIRVNHSGTKTGESQCWRALVGLPGSDRASTCLRRVCSVSARKATRTGWMPSAAKSPNTNLGSCPDRLEVEGAFLPLPCRPARCEHLWYRPFTVWPRKINNWMRLSR